MFNFYDHWKTDPGPAYADEPPPEGEREEFAEPVIDETWDPAAAEYVTTVVFESGAKYIVRQAKSGPFIHDFEVHGPDGFFMDGYPSENAALTYLTDIEHWGW